MITDALENLQKYNSILPRIPEIINYFKTHDILSLAPGKYEIADESIYLLIQEYNTKTESEKKWESHIKYSDIQIVLSGQEYIGYAAPDVLKIKDPYNNEKDVIIYENDSHEHSQLLIPGNYFSIFLPGEAHKPGFHIKEEQKIRKAVIKVKMV